MANIITACKHGYIDIVEWILNNDVDVNQCGTDGINGLYIACELEYTEIVKIFLEQNAYIESYDKDGFTPPIKACLNNHTSTVKLLLKHKPNINARTFAGGGALFFSALNGNLEITQLLLDNGADCNICFNSKDTFKNRALLYQHQTKIFNILKSSTSTNAADYVRKKSADSTIMMMGVTTYSNFKSQYYALDIVADSSPLHIACFVGVTDIVCCLLEHKSNINIIKEDGTTPLFYACELGHTDIVQILLEKNANINLCDNDGNTPLIKACLNNNISIVQLLIKHKPDINARALHGPNALFFSAINGNLEIMQLLLKNGADCKICCDSRGCIKDTPTNLTNKTLKQKKFDIFNIVNTLSPIAIDYPRNEAILYGSFEYCEHYTVKLDYVFNVVTDSSPLHIACLMGRTDIVRCLMEYKVNINMTKEDGTTPLSYACELGHTDIVMLLLDHNANIESCDNDGFTPLIKACLYNHTSTVQLLLKYKPDNNARALHGLNALLFSALNGNLEITQLLLENSAEYHICFNSKDTFNNQASLIRERHKLFNFLVNNTSTNAAVYVRKKSKNDLEIRSCDYNTSFIYNYIKAENYTLNIVADSSPLHIACFMGVTDIVRCLLEHKVININLTKEDGTPPLSYACELGHTDKVKMLLDHNANIESCYNDGLTPLIKACLNNHTSTVQLLIKYKPDINARTVDGTNALCFSSPNGNLEISKVLLENNADCNNCIHSKQLIIESLSGHPNEKLHQKELYCFDIIVNGTTEYISEYVKKKSLNYVFDIFAGSSSLHLACFMGRLDVVHCLLENKANINKRNDHGTTPLSYACELGYTDIVKIFLDQNANIESCDNDGFTSLTISCFNSNISAVQLLIKHKPDIITQTNDGGSALLFGALNGNLELTQLLLENSADCNIGFHSKDLIINKLNNYALFNKIKRKLFESLIHTDSTSEKTADYLRGKYLNYETLKEGGIHYGNSKSVDYTVDVVADSSPLHIACFMGRTDVVRCLLYHNANINMTNEDGTTPFSYACAVGHTDIVKMLLEKHANVDICDSDDFTPLIKACMNNHTSVVQLLIQHNPDINARGLHGFSALFFSAMNGNLKIVKLLLKSSADSYICTDSKEFIKDASTNHTNKTLKQIKPYIFDIVNNSLSLANKNDIDIERVFKHGNQKSVFYDGENLLDLVFDIVTSSTPLHISCFIGDIDIVRCLLKHKAYIDMAKEDGYTSLGYACEKGHTDIVKLLLEKNANVDICNNNGLSPLYSASYEEHIDIVKLLLEKNANVDLCDNNGLGPLLVASQAEQNDIVKLLLQKNHNVDLIETKYSTNALWCSCFKDNSSTSIVELFIKHKPDINAQIIDGSCALFLSALNGNVDIVQLLLENNADCNICCHSKQSIIDKRTDMGLDHLTQVVYVSYLKKASSINVLDYVSEKMSKSKDYAFDVVAGSSPLHIACYNGWINVVHCLLGHKANINMGKEDGTTPLFYACEVGAVYIVRLLLDKGADTQICRIDGKSPFDSAKDNGHESVVKMLRKHSEDQQTISS